MYNCLLLKFTFILTLVLFLTCSEEINTSNKLLSVTKNHPAENMRGVKRKSPAADGIIIDTINSSKSFDFNIIKGMNQINIKDAKTYALYVISCDITGFRKEAVESNNLLQHYFWITTEEKYIRQRFFTPSGETIRIT